MSTGLSVSGNKLLRDGQQFIPLGFNAVAAYHANPTWGFKSSWQQWPNSLQSIKRLGGNTVVIKVLQLPLSTVNTTYVAQIKQMVSDAHAAGLSVVLCVNDQVQTNNPARYSEMTVKITPKTFFAWAQLAPVFADDLDTAFELFNEPDYSSADWPSWRAAMQPLVDQIRKTNQNVIWVPGGAEWDGTYHHKQMTMHGLGTHSLLKGSNLGYSVHPYNYAHVKPTEDAAWHDRYYYLTAVAPVLFSEGYFDYRGNIPLSVASDFLAMCKQRNIGYSGWVIDAPASQELVTYDASATIWNPQPTATGQVLVDWFGSFS